MNKFHSINETLMIMAIKKKGKLCLPQEIILKLGFEGVMKLINQAQPRLERYRNSKIYIGRGSYEGHNKGFDNNLRWQYRKLKIQSYVILFIV